MQATHHRGLVYMTTPEYYGTGANRLLSIYWAIIDPSRHLCKPSIHHWGLVASEQGLALTFPTIAARHDCGAVLAYVYGGNMDVRLNGRSYPAYAGKQKTASLASRWLWMDVFLTTVLLR
jgi:hypothetical protein